jgi:hypothetical protein
MRIGKFKSLFTNIDPNDVKLEYLSVANNVRLRDKATETKFYNWNNIQVPEGIIKVLVYDAIELDNDKLQSNVDSSGKLYPTYNYNIEKDYILVGNTATETQVWLFHYDGSIATATNNCLYNPLGHVLYSKADIFKDNGNIILLLDTDTLWLGKIQRNLWYNGTNHAINAGYYLERYLEPFDLTSQDILTDGNGNAFVKTGRQLGFDITSKVIIDQATAINPVQAKFVLLEIANRHDGGTYVPKDSNANYNDFSAAFELVTTDGNNTKIAFPPGGNYWIFDAIYSVWQSTHNLSDKVSLMVPTSYFIELGNVPIILTLNDGTIPNWKRQLPTDATIPHEPSGDYLLPEISDFTSNTYKYIGTSVASFGFDAADTSYELVVTSILDYKEELVTEYRKVTDIIIPPGTPKYGLELQIQILQNVNSRLTGLAVYIRFSTTTDFYQIASFNFLSSTTLNTINDFVVGEISKNAIELVQTIGTLFNPDNFSIITVFDFFNRINNLPYVAKNNQIYGGVTGNGKILDLFYPSNVIPNITDKTIMAISNMNNIPAIHDVEKTNLIQPMSAGDGSISYTKRDQIGFSIKNRFDVAISPDGMAVNTKEGIMLYNGNSVIPTSKEINDLVELNYPTAMLFYNLIQKDLYYIFLDPIAQVYNTLYRYSFVDKGWTTHDVPTIKFGDLQYVSTDHDGYLLVTTSTSIYRLVDILTGIATIKTMYSDLSRPDEMKSFMEFRFDFIGIMVFNGITYIHPERAIEIIPVPIDLRVPTDKISLTFNMIDNSKLYHIEIKEETIAEKDYATTVKSL